MAWAIRVSDQLRVVVLSDSRAFHTERYVRELRRQGCRVMPVSIEQGRLPHLHLPRITPFQAIQYPAALSAVRRVIRRFRPHIVNAHHASGYGFLAALAHRRGDPPIVLHLWGSDILVVPKRSPLHRWKVMSALRSADLVIGDSGFLIREAAALTALSKSAVIPWGLEREYCSDLPPLDLAGRPLRIITPRPHEPVYDNQTILHALTDHLRNGAVTLTVPEFGSRLSHFQKLARALGVDVSYYKRSPRAHFIQMLKLHQVYLSASRSDSSPVSLLEAMGLGLIPIVADIPGVREWGGPESALLFTPGDAGSLKQCIDLLLSGRTDEWDVRRRRNAQRIVSEATYEENIAATIAAMQAFRRELV